MLCCVYVCGPRGYLAAYIAEDDTKRNYEVLEALDKILESPEVYVTYK